MYDIRITAHAKARFVERFSRMAKSVPKNPEEAIRKMLKQAVPEEMDPVHKVVRLINNKGVEATYYIYSGWRFIIAGNVLITVERTRREQN